MAFTKKIAFYGKNTYNFARAEEEDSSSELCEYNEDFLKYEENSNRDIHSSSNVVDFLQGRELGNQRVQQMLLDTHYGTRKLIQKNILQESEFDLTGMNKVFCSQWLTGQQVIFGTKCNQLLVLDLTTSRLIHIPSLESSENRVREMPGGIHSIQLNPSRSLLATGAQNPNDVAVYKLPTMDPACIGVGAHEDWIFDIVWLDDLFFVTGSRDTTVALWRVSEDVFSQDENQLLSHYRMKPLIIHHCRLAQKIRALTFNSKCKEVVALSLNAYLHLYDVETFRQKFSRKLPYYQENVCLCMHNKRDIYAVGSKSFVTVIDTRTLYPVKNIPSNHEGCSIRSISFLNDLLTIGTGVGILMFYDIRAGKYLDVSDKNNQEAFLKTAKGWANTNDVFRDVYQHSDYAPAVYTHCYDPSGVKLFAAGGPLPASLYGSYAGLWQ